MKSTPLPTLKARKSTARNLGAAAFASGRVRFPGGDCELAAMLHKSSLDDAKLSRENRAIMAAWLNGWDAANLAVPVASVE